MNRYYLGLETGLGASASLSRDGELITTAGGGDRRPDDLPEIIGKVLAVGGVDAVGLAGVVYSTGPGSITGLRIGAATAEALALAAGVEAVGVAASVALGETTEADAAVVAGRNAFQLALREGPAWNVEEVAADALTARLEEIADRKVVTDNGSLAAIGAADGARAGNQSPARAAAALSEALAAFGAKRAGNRS